MIRYQISQKHYHVILGLILKKTNKLVRYFLQIYIYQLLLLSFKLTLFCIKFNNI